MGRVNLIEIKLLFGHIIDDIEDFLEGFVQYKKHLHHDGFVQILYDNQSS